MEAWREELYHHGILGQKWGVRNGPPYPLDESQYSGRERARARRINETARENLNHIVENKAWVEYGKAHPKKYGEHIEDVDDVLNYMSQDFDSPKVNSAVKKIEQDIRSRPDFQNLVNMSYEQAIESERNERIERGSRYVSGVFAALGIGGLAVATGASIYKSLKK